jgi:DNA-binding NtrC family response regulator
VELDDILSMSGDVVIVEDDTTLGPLMVEMLEDIRARCVLFQKADDALAHVLGSHGNCGLLITDHGVPGQIRGAELAAMFRKKWPETPVILTSGYALEAVTLPPGVIYLQKPWPIDTLVRAVAGLLQPGYQSSSP